MVRIEDIIPGGLAEDLELCAGDWLVSVNDVPVADLLEARFLLAAEEVRLVVCKTDGECWELEVEKDLHDDLGLVLAHPEPDHCGNNCVFCFVHQLPKGLRRSLYLKDEDYRFSFLYGSYVTLTNLSERDVERIVAHQLSPLYVSVHATDSAVRARLLGREVPDVMPLLRRLTSGGIDIHAQAVICPGWNDGEVLDRTIEDLAALWPKICSLALVPVGLTRFRTNLPHLRVPTAREAQQVVARVERLQQRFRGQFGTRWLFAADEWYLKADHELPPARDYEDFPQIENGVGMLADFRRRANRLLSRVQPLRAPQLTIVTGTSFACELEGFLSKLHQRTGVSIRMYALQNQLFGGQVSVAGLLGGRDILSQLHGRPLGCELLVPAVMLHGDDDRFLDDLTLVELAGQLQVRTRKIEASPQGIWQGVRAAARAAARREKGSER